MSLSAPEGSKEYDAAKARRLSIDNRELLLAAGTGDVAKVQDLLKADLGVDYNFRDTDGNTPLHWAVRSGKEDVVNALLEHNADVSLENHKNETVMSLAWDLAADDSQRKTALVTIGNAIIKKADRILSACRHSDSRKEAPGSKTTDRGPQHEYTFFEATKRRDFKQPHLPTDIETIVTFFCRPFRYAGVSSDAIKISIDFKTNSDDTVILLCTENLEMYSALSWKDKVNDKFSLELEETFIPNEQSSDQVTEALMAMKRVYDLLSNRKRDTERRRTNDDPREKSDENQKSTAEANKHKNNRDETKGKYSKLKAMLQEVFRRSKGDHLCGSKCSKPCDVHKKQITTYELGRNFFANITNDKIKTMSKMQTTSNSLNEARAKLSSESKFFSHKDALTIICFLEVFALEDIFLDVDMRNEENGDIKKTETKDWDKTYMCKKRKEYYKRHYPSAESFSGEMFFEVIGELRNRLLKDSKKIVTTEDITTSLCTKNGLTMRALFEAFYEFSAFVIQKISHTGQHAIDIAHIVKPFDQMRRCKIEIIDNNSSICISDTEERDLHYRLCEDFQEINSAHDAMYTVIFDLIVNLFPILDTRQSAIKPQILQLRNAIVHKFDKLTPVEIREGLEKALYDYYRYRLAKEIHEIWTKKATAQKQNKTCLDSVFDKCLERVDAQFRNFKFPEQEPLSTCSDITWLKDMEDMVHTYINNVSGILHRSYEQEDDSANILSSRFNPSTVEIREILEQFYYLNRRKGNTSDTDMKDCQESLKDYLRTKLNLDEDQANRAISIVSESEQFENDKFNEEPRRMIVDTLKGLYALRVDPRLKRLRLSHMDITSLFHTFLHGDVSLRQNEQFLKYSELRSDEHDTIENTLRDLPDLKQTVKVLCGSEKVQFKIGLVVENLLTAFAHVQRERQLKIDNVASAFSDDVVISYLVKFDVSRANGQFQLKDFYRSDAVIRDLQKYPYTAPYVAQLLATSKNLGVIRSDSLLELVKSLLHGYSFLPYIECLVSIEDERIKAAFCTALLSENVSDVMNCEVLRILSKKKAVVTFLDVLQKHIARKPQAAEMTKRLKDIMRAANHVALELLNVNELEEAYDLMQQFLKLIEKYTDPDILAEMYLNIAKHWLLKARAPKGCSEQTRQNGEILKDLNEALHYLNELEDIVGLRQQHLMLAKTRKACIFFDLGKVEQNPQHYKTSYELQQHLWEMLWCYVSGKETPAPDYKTFYRYAENSARYQNMIRSNIECFKYLTIPKLKKEEVVYGTTLAFKNRSDQNAMRNLLTDIIRTCDEVFNVWNTETTHDWAYIGSSNILKRKVVAFIYRIQYENCDLQKQYCRLRVLELNCLRYELGIYGQFSNHTKSVLDDLKKARGHASKWNTE